MHKRCIHFWEVCQLGIIVTQVKKVNRKLASSNELVGRYSRPLGNRDYFDSVFFLIFVILNVFWTFIRKVNSFCSSEKYNFQKESLQKSHVQLVSRYEYLIIQFTVCRSSKSTEIVAYSLFYLIVQDMAIEWK